MSLKSEVDQVFLAAVESGNIRFVCLPAGEIPLADDAAWDQLYNAAGSPAVDHWLCGFQVGVVTGIVADVNWLIDIGWGGADHPTNAPTNIVVVSWPIGLTAGDGALGPAFIPNCMLPFPIRIPAGQSTPGSRMVARISSTPLGAIGLSSIRVILATAVGSLS